MHGCEENTDAKRMKRRRRRLRLKTKKREDREEPV
jgi:hypothetical protein